MKTRRAVLHHAVACTLAPLVGAARAEPAAARPAALSGLSSRGERVSLDSLRGSVVLVFTWSASCPVCLDKLPELRRNLDGWQGKPFIILALNQDRTIDDMRSYERLFEQTAPMRSQFKHLWRGAAEHRDNFGDLPKNMPTTLIIDKAGMLAKTIRGRVPSEIWDDIAELVLG
jgi:peroxiredoxin